MCIRDSHRVVPEREQPERVQQLGPLRRGFDAALERQDRPEATDLDLAVAGDEHGVRGEAEVVHAPAGGGGQAGGGLTDDGSGLLAGQRVVLDDIDQGGGAAVVLLDDPRQVPRGCLLYTSRCV